MAWDSVPLKQKKSKPRKGGKEEMTDKDDVAGMLVSAGKSINFREMIIIWAWFLFLHSELFIERVLSLAQGAVDEKQNMTMRGTIYSSVIMMVGIIIIDMVYR